nr:mitochondrial ribosomal protein l50 [Hymenolepis microstoma]
MLCRSPYRPSENVEPRIQSLAAKCLPNFVTLGEPYQFPDRQSKIKFLKACMKEFDHTIPSNILHEMEDLNSVKDYFHQEIKPEDKLDAMVEENARKSNLPPNLVIQIEPIRFDPNDKSFFSKTAFPGRSTVMSGIEESKKYPSYKASKDRRLRINPEDKV